MSLAVDTAVALPEIRLAHLTKRFGEVVAVDDISLTINTGEFFSLLGPSGCGKTTTLRMIGGFDLPTGGTIELRGQDVSRQPPDKRPVNMVFQSYALFPHLDVAGNIAFGLRRRGVDGTEIKRRTGAILELVHLPGYEKRRTHELSGGQQQRVALARALVNEPNVLLLDEPLGALDLKLRKRLQVELKRIQMDVGITFVYVTHDQEEALTMSDRIAVMHRGRIEQVGAPQDLYDRPQTSFVADFIGTTNLLTGTVEALRPDGALVRLDSGDTCRISSDGRTAGQPVQVSIRPESIELRPADRAAVEASDGAGGGPEPTAASGVMTAKVEQVAYLGATVQYHIRTEKGLAMSVLAGRTGPRFESGDSVTLAWAPADALVMGEPPARLEDES
ncbi:MAG TPA: ABC transporter ATP-binding protein [Candidatus Limnocylindrales bacterium]